MSAANAKAQQKNCSVQQSATVLWDAVVVVVFVESVLNVSNSSTDLAETGYQLRGQPVPALKP